MARPPPKPEKPVTPAPATPPKPEADTRIAPDPLCVILPALAALGTIASIAAINWMAQDRTAERSRNPRKVQVALRDLESCCLGLSEIFKRLARSPGSVIGEGATTASALKFGVHGHRIPAPDFRHYQQLINDIATMLVLASQNSFDVMCAIEDGEIEAPEALYFSFGEVQERLNQLLVQRASLKTTVEAGLAAAERLNELVRDLKRYRKE